MNHVPIAAPLRAGLALAFFVLAPCVPTGVAHAASSVVPILTSDQLQPGMKARVRTVFSGQTVEEFDAEIIGVLRGGRVEGDQIIARATSEKAIQSGIAQGMSGSPVYVDGKLIGALSGGWSFVRDAMFVITPVQDMLDVLDAPVSSDASGTAGPAGIEHLQPRPTPRFGPFQWPGEEESPVASAAMTALTDPGAPFALALPLACSGLNPISTAIAQQMFEPLGFRVTAGGRTGKAPKAASLDSLVPGSAVAVDVMRGDLRLAAIGTLTYRDHDRVLLFGHPFFQAGEVRLPLSTASIVTIVNSSATPFKLGATGTPIGTVTQDLRSAVAGRLGPSPHLLPLSITVGAPGRAPRRFTFETIEDRTLLAQLVGLATVNSLLESGGTGGQNTLRWEMSLTRPGAPPLRIGDVMAADAPTTDLATAIASPLRFLAGNPFERLVLDSIQVKVNATPGRDQWTLRNVRLAGAAVRPGGIARVRCDLERWRGGSREIVLEVPVPEEVPAGRFILWVGGGAELTRMEAARLPARYRPISLPDAWDRIASLRRSDRLYAAIIARAPEVTRSGRDYPELPGSAYALLAAGQLAGEDARRGDRVFLSEIWEDTAGLTRGELQIELVVDPNAP
jgi:hypothetical protein